MHVFRFVLSETRSERSLRTFLEIFDNKMLEDSHLLWLIA